jgi:putative nucleotidyltransferase with HDIG domain
MNYMDKILAAIDEMPPFPRVVLRATVILEDPEYRVDDLVDVLMLDQSITANILRISNSAYFGRQRRVSSVREAVVLLGATELRNVLLAGGAFRAYSSGEPTGYSFYAGELWYHAVACAIMTQVIHGRFQVAGDAQMLFTAGLLHDIGKVVLSHFVADAYTRIDELVKTGNYAFQDAEREVLGFDHAEIGGRLAESWQFPEAIVAAIRFHHDPDMAPKGFRPSVELASLADALSLMVGYGTAVDGLAYRGPHYFIEERRLSVHDIEAIIAEFQLEMVRAKDMLELGERGEPYGL